MNPFELFSIPARYAVDFVALEEKYHALQKRFHPDHFVAATQRERLMATTLSADLTKAFSILKNPISRGAALLTLKGYPFDIENEKFSDAQFLMQQLMYNEMLDQANTVAACEALQQTLDADFTAAESDFLTAYQQATFEVAKTALLKMRYLQKLCLDCQHKRQQLALNLSH